MLVKEETDQLTYRIPALANALSVDDDGFCGYLCVMIGLDHTVTEIQLYSDTTEYHFTSYK